MNPYAGATTIGEAISGGIRSGFGIKPDEPLSPAGVKSAWAREDEVALKQKQMDALSQPWDYKADPILNRLPDEIKSVYTSQAEKMPQTVQSRQILAQQLLTDVQTREAGKAAILGFHQDNLQALRQNPNATKEQLAAATVKARTLEQNMAMDSVNNMVKYLPKNTQGIVMNMASTDPVAAYKALNNYLEKEAQVNAALRVASYKPAKDINEQIMDATVRAFDAQPGVTGRGGVSVGDAYNSATELAGRDSSKLKPTNFLDKGTALHFGNIMGYAKEEVQKNKGMTAEEAVRRAIVRNTQQNPQLYKQEAAYDAYVNNPKGVTRKAVETIPAKQNIPVVAKPVIDFTQGVPAAYKQGLSAGNIQMEFEGNKRRLKLPDGNTVPLPPLPEPIDVSPKTWTNRLDFPKERARVEGQKYNDALQKSAVESNMRSRAIQLMKQGGLSAEEAAKQAELEMMEYLRQGR